MLTIQSRDGILHCPGKCSYGHFSVGNFLFIGMMAVLEKGMQNLQSPTLRCYMQFEADLVTPDWLTNCLIEWASNFVTLWLSVWQQLLLDY